MRIAEVDLLGFSIPLARPLATARGAITERAGWIVRLRAADGTIGLGEVAPHPHAAVAEIQAERLHAAELRARLVGADVARFDELVAALGSAPRWVANGFDTALWDLRARLSDRPLVSLLGACRSEVRVNAVLEALDADACADEGRAFVARGFRHAKRKVGHDVESAVSVVHALAERLPALKIRLDANGVWSRAEAVAACRRLRGPNVEWVEQPVAPGCASELAEVRRASGARIAADESVGSAADVRALARGEACDAIVVKLVQMGGLSEARRAVDAANRASLPVAVTSGLDTGVGLAAALALAAAVPGPLAACGLATASMLDGDVVRASFAPACSMRPPAGPGLGVELDEEALLRFGGDAW